MDRWIPGSTGIENPKPPRKQRKKKEFPDRMQSPRFEEIRKAVPIYESSSGSTTSSNPKRSSLSLHPAGSNLKRPSLRGRFFYSHGKKKMSRNGQKSTFTVVGKNNWLSQNPKKKRRKRSEKKLVIKKTLKRQNPSDPFSYIPDTPDPMENVSLENDEPIDVSPKTKQFIRQRPYFSSRASTNGKSEQIFSLLLHKRRLSQSTGPTQLHAELLLEQLSIHEASSAKTKQTMFDSIPQEDDLVEDDAVLPEKELSERPKTAPINRVKKRYKENQRPHTGRGFYQSERGTVLKGARRFSQPTLLRELKSVYKNH